MWVGAKITVTPGRTWKRKVQVADHDGEPYDWYELHILTKVEQRYEFRAVAIGTLQDMKSAAERQPHAYRIVYVGVVLDRTDSSLAACTNPEGVTDAPGEGSAQAVPTTEA